VCAIGDNWKRRGAVLRVEAAQWCDALVHPTACVSRSAQLERGVVVLARAFVGPCVSVAAHSIVNTGAIVEHDCSLGRFVHVAPAATLCGSCVVGAGALCGANSVCVPETRVRPWSLVKAGERASPARECIPIYSLNMQEEHARAVQEAVRSQWLTSSARVVTECEDKLASLLCVDHVILTNNGTSATHCLFLALKHKHPEVRRVYVPDSVYVAAYNAALYEYALDALEVLPIDGETWNVQEEALLALPQGAAVLVVHNLGNPVNVPRLMRARPDLIVLEDNCEGFLGTYEGQPTGSAALCCSISFYANKTITCGEGGAFATNDAELARYIRSCCTQGMSERRYVHDKLGYNYRITAMQAALLSVELERLPERMRTKRALFSAYDAVFLSCDSHAFAVQRVDPACSAAPWMYAVLLPTECSYARISTALSELDVETRPFFYPIHTHAHLREARLQAQSSASTMLSERVIMLPSYPELGTARATMIAQSICELCTKCV